MAFADVCQICSFGSGSGGFIEINGDLQFSSHAAGDLPRNLRALGQGHSLDGNEGENVGRADPRVQSLLLAHVDDFGRFGNRAKGRLGHRLRRRRRKSPPSGSCPNRDRHSATGFRELIARHRRFGRFSPRFFPRRNWARIRQADGALFIPVIFGAFSEFILANNSPRFQGKIGDLSGKSSKKRRSGFAGRVVWGIMDARDHENVRRADRGSRPNCFHFSTRSSHELTERIGVSNGSARLQPFGFRGRSVFHGVGRAYTQYRPTARDRDAGRGDSPPRRPGAKRVFRERPYAQSRGRRSAIPRSAQ